MKPAKEIEQTVNRMKKEAHEMPSRLVDLQNAISKNVSFIDWQEISADQIAETKIFNAAEAEAIVFILAETGGDLDSVDHWLVFGW